LCRRRWRRPFTVSTFSLAPCRLHKAFLRYHDPENWPVLREALKAMGRADLIGPRPDQLVPAHQPGGGGKPSGRHKRHPGTKFTTKGVPAKAR